MAGNNKLALWPNPNSNLEPQPWKGHRTSLMQDNPGESGNQPVIGKSWKIWDLSANVDVRFAQQWHQLCLGYWPTLYRRYKSWKWLRQT